MTDKTEAARIAAGLGALSIFHATDAAKKIDTPLGLAVRAELEGV